MRGEAFRPRAEEVMTAQESALNKARSAFGISAFTEDHLEYRRVGVKYAHKLVLTANGDTWDEAIENLREKVQQNETATRSRRPS